MKHLQQNYSYYLFPIHQFFVVLAHLFMVTCLLIIKNKSYEKDIHYGAGPLYYRLYGKSTIN